MTARCPFCEAVHPVPAAVERANHQLDCPCGATGLLCAASTEPETAQRLVARGLWDTKADVLDRTLSIVWAKERPRRRAPEPLGSIQP
ncbi:MAG: hypothetical protein HY726_07795 [Candidatus Rokubacteria bacterium]|nr:hypothetical protein [Candidatus Rokubacteria bacterium]